MDFCIQMWELPRMGRLVHDDTFRRLLRARDAIHARYAEPLEIADLAREAALSQFHFLRLFREAFGETPHQHLTRVRVEQAKRLLIADAPVTDVCLDVGFQSLGSFSALFARRVGVAPSAFRRRIWGFPHGAQRMYIPCCYLQGFANQQF